MAWLAVDAWMDAFMERTHNTAWAKRTKSTVPPAPISEGAIKAEQEPPFELNWKLFDDGSMWTTAYKSGMAVLTFPPRHCRWSDPKEKLTQAAKSYLKFITDNVKDKEMAENMKRATGLIDTGDAEENEA
jgi:hypothetical protein